MSDKNAEYIVPQKKKWQVEFKIRLLFGRKSEFYWNFNKYNGFDLATGMGFILINLTVYWQWYTIKS